MLPSGPGPIPTGELPAYRPRLVSEIRPRLVIRPIAPDESANQIAPPGPAAIPSGWLPRRRPLVVSEIWPLALTSPMAHVPDTLQP